MSDDAPAVHSGRMWEIPAGDDGLWIHNIAPDPIWIETKAQYFAELHKRGLRMKDQQESRTGPELPPEPPPIPTELIPSPPPAPITASEANIFGAMTGFFRRYGIREALWCDECFARKRPHGVEAIVTATRVSLMCRCGTATFRGDKGTTILARAAHTAIVSADRTSATIHLEVGDKILPAILLQDIEAALLRAYIRLLRARHYDPQWRHLGAPGPLSDESLDLGLKIAPDEIVIILPQMVLYWRGRVMPVLT